MEHAKKIIVLILTLIISSCTIGNYQIRNKMIDSPKINQKSCVSTYSINIEHIHGMSADEFGAISDSYNERLKTTILEYIKSTEEAFASIGCKTSYVKSGARPDLVIRMVLSQQSRSRSKLLNEAKMMGVWFGLVPVWGTYEESVYSFEYTHGSLQRTYYIDKTEYYHILLLPVFWINFFTPDRFDIYKDALINFIERNQLQ